MADKPAPKQIDDALFQGASPSIRQLQKQSRMELRSKARRKFKDTYLYGKPKAP